MADALPPDAQGRLTYDDVRELVGAELDHLRRKGLLGLPGEEPGPVEAARRRRRAATARPATASGNGDGGDGRRGRTARRGDRRRRLGGQRPARGRGPGLDVTDDDVFLVIDALHAYLADIGAVGPQAQGGHLTGPT